jgi:hypothetical protein
LLAGGSQLDDYVLALTREERLFDGHRSRFIDTEPDLAAWVEEDSNLLVVGPVDGGTVGDSGVGPYVVVPPVDLVHLREVTLDPASALAPEGASFERAGESALDRPSLDFVGEQFLIRDAVVQHNVRHIQLAFVNEPYSSAASPSDSPLGAQATAGKLSGSEPVPLGDSPALRPASGEELGDALRPERSERRPNVRLVISVQLSGDLPWRHAGLVVISDQLLGDGVLQASKSERVERPSHAFGGVRGLLDLPSEGEEGVAGDP